MTKETSLEFRLRKTNETRNYLLEEIKRNNLFSERHKKTCKYLNYVEHLFILVLTISGCGFNFCICFINLCFCCY